MNNQIKKIVAAPLFTLSLLTAFPQIVDAMEATDVAQQATQEAMKATKPDQKITLTPPKLFASLIFLIPMWQCYRKSPKAIIPAVEEYSWNEIRESLNVLLSYYSAKFSTWFWTRKAAYSDEEVMAAWQNLQHNMKNLYNMGIVGQKKYSSVAKATKAGLEWSASTPARGICGNLFDMLGDGEKVFKRFLYLCGAYHFLKHITTNECQIEWPFKVEW